MKLRTLIILLLIAIILVVVKLVFLSPQVAVTGGAPKEQIFNVTCMVATPQELENKIFSSGTVMAKEEVLLRPEVSGKLVSILFEEEGNVTKGALLAKINDADLQAQLKKLTLELKLAKDKETRLKGLMAIKGVSQEEYDAAANQLETIATDMDYTRAQIAKTEIRAPFSGRVGLKKISEGSFVTNADVIATMQQTNVLKIDFTVPEKYASIVSSGDEIHFRVANQKEQFSARVLAIEPKIDEQTRNITIRAVFNNSGGNIFPGSFAQVELIANKKEASILIPTEAVIPEMKGSKVYLNKGGKAISTKVETGTRTDAQIEIVSGISAGDTVIITGIMSLKPNASVKIIELKK